LHLVRASALVRLRKPSPLRSPLFSTTPPVPSHLTHPLSPCAGLGALPELRVAPRPEEPTLSPLLSSGVVDRVGEFRISITRPPHYELVLSTVSARCAVVHGQRPCSPSRRAKAVVARTFRAVWATTWAINMHHVGPRWARQHPVVRALSVERTAAVLPPVSRHGLRRAARSAPSQGSAPRVGGGHTPRAGLAGHGPRRFSLFGAVVGSR
jgi:hypothetical protein